MFEIMNLKENQLKIHCVIFLQKCSVVYWEGTWVSFTRVGVLQSEYNTEGERQELNILVKE